MTLLAAMRETGTVKIARRDFSPAVVGWTMIGAIAAAIALLAVGTSIGASVYGMTVAGAFALVLLHSAAVPVALLRPVAAAIGSVLAVPLLSLAATGGATAPWPWSASTNVTQAIVVFLVTAQSGSKIGVGAWLLSVAGTIGVWFLHPRDADASAVNIIVAAAIIGVAFMTGMVLREWRSIWGQLMHERAVSAEEHGWRVVAEEKARIARELHDVVAHNMSIINVRASTAAYRFTDVPGPLVSEFDDIATEARNALVELRRLLSVLRAEDGGRELAPQPTLADIPALVQASTRSGAEVSLVWDVDNSDGVADLASLAAFRIVQESISNALRHAPGAAITVECVRLSDTLKITVTNAPPQIPVTAGVPGHGMTGMRERAAAIGGTLDAAFAADRSFVVRAVLPLSAAEVRR
ncbi:MAG: two component system sensor kinase [Glaciihabitans sp.]|nr:two component system sensor kinase [Glaciihabitans sp.]